MAPLTWLLVAGIFILVVAVYSRLHRVTIGRSGRKWAFFGILFVMLGLHIAVFLANILATKPYISAGVWKIGLGGLIDGLPGGALLVWGVCGAVVAVCYWLARRQFERIEVSLPSSSTRG
jgi:hypothetical protein